jgi:hypothetical protein
VTEYLAAFAATAKKELKDLPPDAIGRLLPGIRELTGNPRPAGCKNLHGYKDRWRIRAVAPYLDLRAPRSRSFLHLLDAVLRAGLALHASD